MLLYCFTIDFKAFERHNILEIIFLKRYVEKNLKTGFCLSCICFGSTTIITVFVLFSFDSDGLFGESKLF